MKLLVLAKSSKHGNYCLAGLNLDTYKFVRILGSGEYGAFLDSDCKLDNGKKISLLDCIEINLKKENDNHAQTENYSCVSKTATYCCKYSYQRLIDLYQDTLITDSFVKKSEPIGYLTRNNYKTVSHSLELIKVNNLTVYPNWTCSFDFKGEKYCFMKITDFNFKNKSCNYSCAYLLVSLSGEDRYTLENNKFYVFVSSIFVD